MKNKMISITEELFENLKAEENASALICRLLYNHFGEKNLKNMNLDEKETYLKNLLAVRKAERELNEKKIILKNGTN